MLEQLQEFGGMQIPSQVHDSRGWIAILFQFLEKNGIVADAKDPKTLIEVNEKRQIKPPSLVKSDEISVSQLSRMSQQ
jgi:hypothetical protein